jgi:hypothetical protein
MGKEVHHREHTQRQSDARADPSIYDDRAFHAPDCEVGHHRGVEWPLRPLYRHRFERRCRPRLRRPGVRDEQGILPFRTRPVSVESVGIVPLKWQLFLTNSGMVAVINGDRWRFRWDACQVHVFVTHLRRRGVRHSGVYCKCVWAVPRTVTGKILLIVIQFSKSVQ